MSHSKATSTFDRIKLVFLLATLCCGCSNITSKANETVTGEAEKTHARLQNSDDSNDNSAEAIQNRLATENSRRDDETKSQQIIRSEQQNEQTTDQQSSIQITKVKQPMVHNSNSSGFESITQATTENDGAAQNDESAASTINGKLRLNSKRLLPNEQNRIKSQLKNNPWAFLHPYNATYDIYSDGEKLGSAHRKLQFNDDLWKLQIYTKLKKWLLTLKSEEHSEFKIQQKELLTTEFYSSTKVSFKKEKIIQQFFDWQQKFETGTKDQRSWKLPIENQLYDRMSHILRLRADILSGVNNFDYWVSYKGSRKVYSYAIQGNEQLSTEMGKFETIRLDRIDGDDSSFSIWLSPELNYFPVKIAQVEQDKPDIILLLSNLEFIEFSNATTE